MRRIVTICGLLALITLPACGTVNCARWAYGKPSVFAEADEFSESVGMRAMLGVPVILGGVAFDLTTWPLQALFGVWPWWGRASTQMDPNEG